MSDMVGNPGDWFSHNEVHYIIETEGGGDQKKSKDEDDALTPSERYMYLN